MLYPQAEPFILVQTTVQSLQQQARLLAAQYFLPGIWSETQVPTRPVGCVLGFPHVDSGKQKIVELLKCK